MKKTEIWKEIFSIPKYLVEKYDIDWFRCDFAHFIPINFWYILINKIKKIKKDFIFIWEIYKKTKELSFSWFDLMWWFNFYNFMVTYINSMRKYIAVIIFLATFLNFQTVQARPPKMPKPKNSNKP